MTVARLTEDRLAAVAALEQVVFFHPWSAESLRLLCGDTAFGYVCLSEEGRLMAYGGMLTVLDEGQITNVATHPDFRRRGAASAVLGALLDGAAAQGLQTVTLEVRASNAAAIALYRKFGFNEVGRRPHFYTHPAEAALVMRLDDPHAVHMSSSNGGSV